MFLDEDLPKKKEGPQTRNLDPLSVQELKEYILWLQEESQRTEKEITRKEAAGATAASFFKS